MSIGSLMLDLAGTSLNESEKNLLQRSQVGGVILFARNFESKQQVQTLVAEIRSLRPELLLAVDQEGGRVQRFREGFTRLPAMQSFLALYQQDAVAAEQLVEDCGWLMAVEILACGLDFSFAPVLDVDKDFCQVIADRSFSDNPQEVTRLAGAFIRGMHDAGMAATGKHFPGHGAVSGDSHLVLPTDERSWAEIQARDWQPFAGLSSGAGLASSKGLASGSAVGDCVLDAVMPAHIVYPQVDEKAVGFSSFWLQEKLRGDLGFEGVIFSDDLTMEGASIAGNYTQRAEQALAAGCDMVLVCNNPQGAEEVLAYLEEMDAPPSKRLASMSRRKQWQWSDIEQSPRWQETVKRLADLVA